MILLLAVAVRMDFKHDRINNGWILFGILGGFLFQIQKGGKESIYYMGISMLLAFGLLYPIYKIGGIGAGDVKLFLMTGCFLTAERLLYALLFSFLIGAVFSLGKMMREENFKERMQYLFSYLFDVIRTGKWKLYGENLRKGCPKYRRSKIHFALPICLGVMLGLGGLY